MHPFRPLAIRLGGKPWLARFSTQIVVTDRFIQWVTRGRFTLLGLAGLPELMLGVRGARSGLARTTPLLCVPREEGWLVAGSNWGHPQSPAWVANLRAADVATVTYRGRTSTVVPRLVTGEEREQLWRVMVADWPNYAKYAERTDREIPVFELVPADSPTT